MYGQDLEFVAHVVFFGLVLAVIAMLVEICLDRANKTL